MSAESKWDQVKDLYLRVGDLPAEEREVLLKEVEADDPEVAAEVRELLSVETQHAPDIAKSVWSAQVEHRYAFAIGQTLLNRFEILEFLGAGGTGEVYKSYDHTQRLFVAVKTLQRGILGGRAATSLLRNEINTARQIAHRNVCKLFDVHIEPGEDDVPFFTMEWIQGRTLAEELRASGPLSLPVVRAYTDQLLAGLEAAQESNVVHRDLKSHNIMLTGSPARLVVMDFGLARQLSNGAERAKTETTISMGGAGTLAYMAPELLSGGSATFASDLHSVGVILFEMLTLRRPFEGSPAEIISKRMTQDAPSILEFDPSIDRRWAYAIARCLESEASRRPQTVQELRSILDQGPPMLWNRRRALYSGIAAAGALGGITAFGASRLRREPATVAIADLDGQTANQRFDDECRRAFLALSPLLSGTGEARSFLLRQTAAQRPDGDGARFLLHGRLRNGSSSPELQVELRDLVRASVKLTEVFLPGIGSKMVSQTLAQKVRDEVAGWTNSTWSWKGPAEDDSGLMLDYYIRARSLMENSSPANAAEAQRYFELSLARNPKFALAWAGLADAHLAAAGYVTGGADERVDLAGEAARKALGLEPNLAEAHCSLAAVEQHRRNWRDADRHYRETFRIKPFFSRAHRWYAGFALQFGRFEEVREHLRLAMQQDPYDQANIVGGVMYLMYTGQSEEAIALGEPAVQDRDAEGLRFNLLHAYIDLGLSGGSSKRTAAQCFEEAERLAKSLAAIEARNQSRTRPSLADSAFAPLYAAQRRQKDLEPYLERLNRDFRDQLYGPADLATVHALLGDTERALTLLEEAFRTNLPSLMYLKVNPFFASLRSNARFTVLVRALEL